MYHTYILQSLKDARYYVGQTEDMEARLKRHNLGEVHATKSRLPWRVVYTEDFPTRSEAFRREMEIKRYKSGILFKKLLGLWRE